MAYVGIGQETKVLSKPNGTSVPMTPEQIKDQQLSAQALSLCNQLGQAGALVIKSGPYAGRRAVLGTQEMTECMLATKSKLEAGSTAQEASDAVLQEMADASSKKWLYAGIAGAALLVGGAWWMTRK